MFVAFQKSGRVPYITLLFDHITTNRLTFLHKTSLHIVKCYILNGVKNRLTTHTANQQQQQQKKPTNFITDLILCKFQSPICRINLGVELLFERSDLSYYKRLSTLSTQTTSISGRKKTLRNHKKKKITIKRYFINLTSIEITNF